MHRSRLLDGLLAAAILAGGSAREIRAQEPAPPEITTQTTPFTLKVQSNEVPVRVVVRDHEGRAVRNLRRENFRLLDEGKPQVVTRFYSEGQAEAPATSTAGPGPAAALSSSVQPPERFVALYFDDLVMKPGDLARLRPAATHYLENSLQPTDRAGLYTSSGEDTVDFTADRGKLVRAIAQLKPVYLYSTAGEECPDLSDYQAWLIDEMHDAQATDLAQRQVFSCLCHADPENPQPAACPGAAGRVASAARMRWRAAQQQEKASLGGLRDLVRRLSVMPGQRSIVFVSRGFFSATQTATMAETIDRAVRAGVVINSLDARGLYTLLAGGDASQRNAGLRGAAAGQLIALQTTAAQQDADVLSAMAEGTGGVFFQNNNDMNAGFRAVGALADFYYVLVFSPSDLKTNGEYHHLKVTLEDVSPKSQFRVQARRGYFAPTTAESRAHREEDEIADAVFSRDQMNSSWLRFGMRFFKTVSGQARVTIVANLDPAGLRFRSENGLHVDDVTFVTVLFDGNGNLVEGVRKLLKMRLKDSTLESARGPGITTTSDFQVPPGTYLVREVVRDQGGMVSTANDTIEIPY